MLSLFIDPGTMGFSRTLTEHAVAASEAGLDGVEIPVTRARELGTPEAVRALVDDLGLSAPLFSCPWELPATASVDEELFARRLRELPGHCEFVARAGGRKLSVMFRGPATPAPLGQTEVVDRLGALTSIAATFALQICVELNDPPLLARADELLREVGRPHAECALLLDVYHVVRSGLDGDWIASLPPGSIGWVHLSDAPPSVMQTRPVDGPRRLPGDGILPLVEWLQTCVDLGVDSVSVEVLDPLLVQRSALDIAVACRNRAIDLVARLQPTPLARAAGEPRTTR